MGCGQVVKAPGFDPGIPGSNPGTPVTTCFYSDEWYYLRKSCEAIALGAVAYLGKIRAWH